MFKWIFGTSGSITQASALIFVVTIISKIIAYLESAIVAAYFGTSAEIDMFYLANSMSVRFVFTIFAGLSIVGVTMYNNAVAVGGKEKGDRFVSGLLSVVVPFALAATIILFILAPVVANLMTANYTVSETETLCLYIRALSFVTVFYAMGVVLTAALNANKQFMPGALCTIIQNVTLIIFIVIFSSRIKVWSVIIGFICGYLVQGLFLYLCIRRIIILRKFTIQEDVNPKQLGLLLVPLILGDATGEVNLLVDQFISTEFGGGYVSALSYGGSLDEFVSSFFIQSISSVLLPFFSTLAAEKKYKEMLVQIRKVFNMVIIMLIPVTIVTVFCASDIVTVVYQRGEFDAESVRITSAALTGYGIGFICKAIFVLIRRPFYAVENTRVPMYLSMFSVVVNITLTIFLGRMWGIFGVTIATTIAFFLGDVIAVSIMNKVIPGRDWSGEGLFFGKLLIATVASGALSYIVASIPGLGSLLKFVICTLVCFVVYAVCLWVLRMKEFGEITAIIKEKLELKG